MTDIEDFRLALAEAVALPGEVRPRPGAGHALRARARRRRRVTLVAGAAAVPACLVLVAVLLGGGGPGAERATTPAEGGTTSAPAAAPSIAPGPRTLSAPIEIRPVVQEFLLCPDDTSGTVPAAGSDNCYRLGPAKLTLSRVQNVETGPRTGPNGLPDDGVNLLITMTSRDAATFAALTTDSVGEQIAIVVDGKVWGAPIVETPIRGGTLAILLDHSPAAALIPTLTR